MADTDVFIIAASRSPQLASALRESVRPLGANPGRVQDAIFGWDDQAPGSNGDILHQAGLACPSTHLSSSLRALFFAAQSILAGDADLVLVAGGLQGDYASLLLASASAVGRLNLAPRALVGTRGLGGVEDALRRAGLSSADVDVTVENMSGALAAVELLSNLETHRVTRGMVVSGGLVLLIERV